MSNILELKNLSRVVESKEILFDISYSFETNKIFTIIGPSGAGKSSLLRLLNRLDEPTGGEIFFNDTNINSLKPSELRSKIGYLFQSPYLFEKTVRDNFLYVDAGLDDAKISELLTAVNLTSDFIDKNVDKLSIGEKQRVALARLLVTNPDIILLDEPTSALDPSITETIEQLILSIVKQQNLTAILVTHNPQQALRIGQNALLLVNGKLVETGTVDEVLNNPKTDFGKKYKAKELR